MLKEKALEMARGKELDLVQVAPEADPPVCRIMDYGKYMYRQKKRNQKSRKSKHTSHVKEVRLRMRISEHDLEVKLKRAREFLTDGDRVLVSLLIRGREMAHLDMAKDILRDIIARLEDVSKPEQEPKVEGRQVKMVLLAKQ